MGKWWCRSRSEDSEALEGEVEQGGMAAVGGGVRGEMRVGRGGDDWGYEGRSHWEYQRAGWFSPDWFCKYGLRPTVNSDVRD